MRLMRHEDVSTTLRFDVGSDGQDLMQRLDTASGNSDDSAENRVSAKSQKSLF